MPSMLCIRLFPALDVTASTSIPVVHIYIYIIMRESRQGDVFVINFY